MARWALVQLTNPWATPTGERSMVRELTAASSRSFKFSTADTSTLDFSMPGRHAQTAGLVPLVSDVLVFRDALPVQRYRLVSRVLSKDSGVLTASFSAVSYKELLNGWMFHDTDQRIWSTATEQTAIAWSIIATAQARSASSNLGLSRGPVPVDSQTRKLEGSTVNYQPTDFFTVGQKVGEAVQQIADMTSEGAASPDGFEWDSRPRPGRTVRRAQGDVLEPRGRWPGRRGGLRAAAQRRRHSDVLEPHSAAERVRQRDAADRVGAHRQVFNLGAGTAV